MRILHIIDSVDPAKGGPIESVKQWAAAVAHRGHTIEVACVDSPDATWLADFPIPVHALGPAYTGFRYAPELGDWLMRHLPEFDAVVVDGLWQAHGPAVRAAALHHNKPYFVFSHGMLDPWFKRTYPRKHLKKLAFWRVGQYPVLRDARSVLFTCEEEAKLAPESFRPNTWNSTIVSLGTSGPPGEEAREREAFLTAFPHLADKRVILFLGRIAPKKGADLLIRGFAAVASTDPSLALVFAGPVEPALGLELKALTEELKIADRVTWTGMLTGDCRWGAYRAAEVFALISHQENFGISVIEALACGVPILLSDKVNIWREIQEGDAGFVGPDTSEAAKELLQRWLDLGDAERTRMKVRALSLFSAKFEINAAAAHFIRVLQGGNGS